MKLVDTIGEMLSKSPAADVSGATRQYWSGRKTGGCMETLAKQGVVLEELGDEESRKKRFKKLIGFSQTNVPEPFKEEMANLIPGWGKTSQ
jgi:hypothetical protein